jgi:flagellin
MATNLNSVNTNRQALTGLQSLNQANRTLDQVQNRISTGRKVIGAVDDASSFSIAQNLRGELGGFQAVSQGIANAQGLSIIAQAGATQVSDLLGDAKAKAIAGANAANTPQQQQILNQDFQAITAQINQTISNSAFNGTNLISSTSTNVNVIANTDGSSVALNATPQVGNAAAAVAGTNISNAANAQTAIAQIDQAFSSVGAALGQLGSDFRTLRNQDQFVQQISDQTEIGLGSIVDADLSREAARLNAAQVRQGLSGQTLNIANRSPQTLTALFR